MALRDLEEFFDPTLVLPIRGKQYVVQSPDALTGIHIQRLFNTATAAFAGAEISAEDLAALELDDEEEADLYPKVLGDAYTQMMADGLPWVWIKHAGTTALMWIGLGMDSAIRFWSEVPQADDTTDSSSAGLGKSGRPAPQDRKAPAPKTAKKAAPRSKPA